MKRSRMKHYRATIDGGGGGSKIIRATSARAAYSKAERWAKAGRWSHYGTAKVRVVSVSDSDDEEDGYIDVKPNPSRRIRRKSMTVRNAASVKITQSPDGHVDVVVRRKGKRR